MFSESSSCLLGQHESCSAAQRPGELSENILHNLFRVVAPDCISLATIAALSKFCLEMLRSICDTPYAYLESDSSKPQSAVPTAISAPN